MDAIAAKVQALGAVTTDAKRFVRAVIDDFARYLFLYEAAR